ncbi:RNA-binding protein [Luteimonas terrae]|uniref:RNA-binding protein n=2 Tax=Luteimonas terrae TaxID=1530191 RepID=A0ABU1XW50_9GAMM|nr:RNA-binding protein [Luteimonas terrae]
MFFQPALAAFAAGGHQRLEYGTGASGGHDILPAAFISPIGSSMSNALTAAQTRFLRGQAHGIKAMLQVGGKGISEALIAEINAALEHHELIKVKVGATDRDVRDAMITDLAARTDSALVQRIGHVAVLYRQSTERRQIVLPRS